MAVGVVGLVGSLACALAAAGLAVAQAADKAGEDKAADKETAAALPNPFYAYCVGIGTGKENASLEAQLELPAMLSELGYAGMAYVGLNGAEEMLQALEKQSQKLFAVYTPLVVDPDHPGRMSFS